MNFKEGDLVLCVEVDETFKNLYTEKTIYQIRSARIGGTFIPYDGERHGNSTGFLETNMNIHIKFEKVESTVIEAIYGNED